MRARLLSVVGLALFLAVPGVAEATSAPRPGRLYIHLAPIIRAGGADLALTGQRVRVGGVVGMPRRAHRLVEVTMPAKGSSKVCAAPSMNRRGWARWRGWGSTPGSAG